MAKSLRSKWRRKCRAFKRVRYGEKELARLKKTLGIDENATGDAEMKEISEIATVTDAKTIKEQAAAKEQAATIEQADGSGEDQMDLDGVRVYNKKTLRDQYGNYPVWMSRRKISKHKHARTKGKNVATKQTKKKPKKARNKSKKQ